MSTTLLLVVCGLLVFAPFVLEVFRFAVRFGLWLARRRHRPGPLPEYGSRFESSVQSRLYERERWRRLEVRPAAERRDRAPGRLRRRLRPVPDGATSEQDEAARQDGAIRAA